MSLRKIHDVISFPEKFWNSDYQELFPPELLHLLVHLHEKFDSRRKKLLEDRQERQALYDRGELPTFLDRTSEMITGPWRVAPIPNELSTRRVEITGPVHSAKMVINMLSRNDQGDRADMAMLDFEDSMKPTFENVLNGYKNVIGAVAGNLTSFVGNKKYQINQADKAYVMVRCRGLHLSETNLTIHGSPVSGGLLDLSVCFFHTAKMYLEQGITPKYYIPKCEHHLEARWWNDLFTELELKLSLPVPTLRATFLIETLPATFQVEEILFEIREHAVGMNVGRWDKIFSDIKVLKNHPDRILGNRSTISMQKPWMENYAKRVIKICHDRGAFAIGGMAAFTPGKTEELRSEQSRKVLEDKQREANWGHDGCWVSHPYFISVALKAMTFTNQLHKKITFDKYSDILPRGDGPHSLEGLRTNIRVGIAYLHGWNQDLGCIALDNLMEDLATLEISRAQTWQWLHHKIKTVEGLTVTRDKIKSIFEEEYQKLLNEYRIEAPLEEHRRLELELGRARDEAFQLFTSEKLQDFLTLASEPT